MIRVGQRYRKAEIADSWDAIVIGSGIGGLSAAALLAKHAGQRVLVLERHYMPGGFTHVYRRHGYEWDVGVHYIGNISRDDSRIGRLFAGATDGTLEWAPMADVYDRCYLADRAYDFPAGAEAFRDTMKAAFPGEAEAIDRYLQLIRLVSRKAGPFFAEKAVPPWVSRLFGGLMRRGYLEWAKRTTREVLESLTSSRELIGVLTTQWGDYGLPPGRSSFAIHALVARHYLWGACYPVGGSSSFARSMAPLVEAAEGAIVYQAEVEEILLRGGRACGVRLADGRELEAPVVVSDAGLHNTYLRLLPAGLAEGLGLRASASRVQPSTAHLCLYAGFRQTAEELGLETTNLWLYPGPDHDTNVERFVEDTSNPLPVVYASFPSAKDPTFEERYPGRATIELITLASFDEFKPWHGTEWRQRGDEYESLKESYGRRMLERLDDVLPGLVGQIDYYEVSTPLSTRHFANYEVGEIYGLDHSPKRFAQRFLRPRTPIPGLFLTGQDITSAGIVPSLLAGYLSASAIVGRNLLGAAMKG
jgi:all-trans-retinol 13,14-reductase